MGVLPQAPLVADALVVRAQALDAEVEAHDVVDLRKPCDPNHVCAGPRQLGFDPRGREGFLEESGEGTAKGFERCHGRDPRLAKAPALPSFA